MKKVFIRKEDYDSYSLKLPLNFLTKRKRKNYVLRELEKIHPCFSANSCSDTKLKLGKFGLMADVTVMERYKLSEYKVENPNKRLFLENKPTCSVFNNENERKRVLILSLVALMSFATIKICDYFLNSKSEAKTSAEISSETESASASLLAPQELFAAVLASIRSKNGKVTNLSWANGNCKFAVTGCSNEDIVGANFCVVSYSSGKPQFNFSANVNDRKMQPKAEIVVSDSSNGILHSSFVNVENIIPALRKTILSSNADLISEKNEKNQAFVTFVCEPQFLKIALKNISDSIMKSGWCETGISLDCDNQYVSVSISLKNLGGFIKTFDTPLSVLSNYSDVFFSKKNFPKIVNSQKKDRVFEKSIESKKEKVGEIRKNGSLFIYYKNSDGKIISEVKNAN